VPAADFDRTPSSPLLLESSPNLLADLLHLSRTLVGFPDIDIGHLEGKAASSGVTIADLEPLLLTHLGASNEEQQKQLMKPPEQVVIEITNPVASSASGDSSSSGSTSKGKGGGILSRLAA
jgi:hypothetical protein